MGAILMATPTRNNDTVKLILISGHIFTLLVFGTIVLGMMAAFFFGHFGEFPDTFKAWGSAGIAYFMTNKFPDMLSSYIVNGDEDDAKNKP